MKKNFIILHQTTWQSLISDIFTFGCIALLLYANYRWLGNHGSVASLLTIAGLFVPLAYSKKKEAFTNAEDAKKAVDEYFTS